jgi:hypothetical protein
MASTPQAATADQSCTLYEPDACNGKQRRIDAGLSPVIIHRVASHLHKSGARRIE